MITKALWHITTTNDPYENLATEEYLRRQVLPGEIVLYLWQNANTVVIGRNQNARGECRVEELEADGGFLARRLSGGGAVYHDLGNLNFSFLVCEEDYDVKRQTEVLIEAARSFGIEAQLTGRNDVTVGEQKFSGHAYYRSGGKCCHHGTVMLSVDTDKLSRYLNVSQTKLQKRGVKSVRSRVVNLRELCPDMTVEELKVRLIKALERVYGIEPSQLPESRIDHSAIAETRAMLASDGWRYGAEKRRELSLKGAFPWGELTINYNIKEGRLADVQLWSDGLEADLLAGLPELLEGKEPTPSALAQALKAETEAEKAVYNDIISLFKTLS